MFIYQVGLALFGLVYLPGRFLSGRRLDGIGQRLGRYSPPILERFSSQPRPVWIHMVSVGEVMAAQELIRRLRDRLPGVPWVVTTTTPTGQEMARRLLSSETDTALYLPWDLTAAVRRAVRLIRPCLFICFETELWPVLFRELQREGVPIVIVNGRISQKAYRRYLWVRFFMTAALKPVRLFLAQSAEDARRFAGLGASKDRIVVTGNVKWDLKTAASGSANGGPDWRGLFGFTGKEILWTAGSTHPGEEKVILESYRQIRQEQPVLRLLIAPRHPERVPEVEKEAAALGLATVRRSRLETGSRDAGQEAKPVILLDTIGELPSVYGASDIVFVGGSLVPKGGHNFVEPALLSRPILTGPHVQNFEEMARQLLQAGGLTMVGNADELNRKVRQLAQDPALRSECGRRAYSVIRQNEGAAAKTVELILKITGGGGA